MTDSQKWLSLTLATVVAWLLYLLAPVLAPFFLGLLLAYLGDPLVDRLELLGLRRGLSVIVVFVAMFFAALLSLAVLLPTMEKQAELLINGIPQGLEWLQQNFAPKVAATLGMELINIDIPAARQAIVEHWSQVGSVAGRLVAQVGRSGQMLVGWLAYLLLVFVATFYFLRDWNRLVLVAKSLLPTRLEAVSVELAREIDAVLAEFLRGQLTVIAVLIVFYTMGLWVVGLDLAFFIGTLSGIVSFVPYLGVIVGIALAGFAALLQFQDFIHVAGVVAVFGTGQLLEGMLLSPWLVGDRIGLHPVAVIFAIMAGGHLFGFLGVLLALPAAAIIVVLLRHFRKEYLRSVSTDNA